MSLLQELIRVSDKWKKNTFCKNCVYNKRDGCICRFWHSPNSAKFLAFLRRLNKWCVYFMRQRYAIVSILPLLFVCPVYPLLEAADLLVGFTLVHRSAAALPPSRFPCRGPRGSQPLWDCTWLHWTVSQPFAYTNTIRCLQQLEWVMYSSFNRVSHCSFRFWVQ